MSEIYAPVIDKLKALHGDHFTVERDSSVRLASRVLKGDLLAAWVALPIALTGLSVLAVPYSEPLLGVLPAAWKKTGMIDLAEMSGRPFFWFPSARNPCWHERMGAVFSALKFRSVYIEEPLEYEVMLARMAAGEGWALVPSSFSAVLRQGVELVNVRDMSPLKMGIAYCDGAGEILARKLRNELIMPE